MAKLIGDVAPFDVTEVVHPAHEFLAEWIVVRGSRPDVPDTRRLARLLRARRQRPRRRSAAEKRDELAAFQWPMSPVLPTGRIAHPDTADCCIHPPGRNEMIAITPPIISSKEVAQKQATPLTAPGPPHRQKSFLTKFPGDGAWMNFRFSRALPPGASRSRRDERHSIRCTLPPDHLFA